jgi:hypothetical protein
VRGRGARVRGAATLVLRARQRNANRLSGRDSDFKARGAFGAGAGAVTATEAARCVVGIVRGDGVFGATGRGRERWAGLRGRTEGGEEEMVVV